MQTVAAEFNTTAVMGPFVVSPDGARIACGEYQITGSTRTAPDRISYVRSHFPMVLDARTGKQALALTPGRLVMQQPNQRVIASATYLLEFYYRIGKPGGRLVAGGLLGGNRETLSASRFSAPPGQWAFGRLAIKTYADTQKLTVGFEAEGGPVQVDDVSLRPIRFPSANLLANAEPHAIEPTFVRDYRVQYDRIPGTLKEKLMRRVTGDAINHVAAFKQGMANTATIFLEEEGFLHNGCLDDIGQKWVYMPDNIGFSIVLMKPTWVSHVVLYLNSATPDNVYHTISLLANNLDTHLPEVVALVRGNLRRFVVVHFPKLLHTDLIKVLPGRHGGHHECLTGVEVYGPLGGPDMAGKGKGFSADPAGVPMFMGAPSHAPKTLPDDLVGKYVEQGRLRTTPTFNVGGTVVDGEFTFGHAAGYIQSLRFPNPDDRNPRVNWGRKWTIGTVTPTTTPTRYAGRMLVGSADYRLHAVADNGMHLWAFKADGRVYSCPAPDGDAVYFGSDDGRLYKVDVDSGILIWEFRTGGKVRSSPALADGRVFFASWDGFLYCVDAETGLLVGRVPITLLTRASPAVRDGRVIIGDEGGAARCFGAANGEPLWQHEIGGRLSNGPVVTPAGVYFFTEQGAAAGVLPTGKLLWKRALGVRVCGQPCATKTQLIVPTEKGPLVLRQADGNPDVRFVAPENAEKSISAVPYGGRLCVTVAYAWTDARYGSRTYATYVGYPAVWVLEDKEKDSARRRR